MSTEFAEDDIGLEGKDKSVCGSEELDRCRERPAEGRSAPTTHFDEETGDERRKR